MAIKQKISAELPQLLSKMNAEQQKLGKVIENANQNLGQLDTTLAERTSEIDSVISKHTGELNKRLVQKVKALDASLAMRTKAMDKTLVNKVGEIDKTFMSHREAIDATMQQKAAEIDRAIASQAKAMDASLTEKARTIDAALDQRLAAIEEQATQKPAPRAKTPSNLSMLRGSEALEQAMNNQSQTLHSRLGRNSAELEQTINRQNEMSAEITALKEKYEQLVKEQVEQATSMIKQFSTQGSQLKATAGLLSGPDMKMSAMVGPQQNKARAILADLATRADELEKNRAAYASALDNSRALGEETANTLRQLLDANASPRAEREKERLQLAMNQSAQNIIDAKKWMEDYSQSLLAQVVELVSGMSRSSSSTRVLPGEVATTSTNVEKAVEEQLQALDALASISGAAINNAQANATGGVGGHVTTSSRSAAPIARGGNRPPRPPVASRNTGRTTSDKPSQWSFGDLLARVADTDVEHEEQPLPTYRPATSSVSEQGLSRRSAPTLDPMDVLRMDDLARALDSHTAAIAWNRSQSGERNVFSRRLYTAEGQRTFDQINERYHADDGFRNTVEKYVNDFEEMLNEADLKDPSGRIVQNYITSETGRAYLMLAHISGRLG